MARDKREGNATDRRGVLGGTFDPIHHGHLIAAQTAVERISLDELWLMPVKSPPHRDQPSASADRRLEMVREAVHQHPHLRVSDLEMELEQPSYTVDTMETLLERHPEVDWCFLTGMDELASFKEWHEWRRLLDIVDVVGMKRPSHSTDDVSEEILERIQVVDIPQIELSSTEVRNRCSRSLPIRYLVPDSVRAIIDQRELYRD